MGRLNKKVITSLFLNSLLATFSFVVPKNKNLFIIGAREGNTFAENSKYVYLYANKRKSNNKFVWITKNKEVLNQLKDKRLPVVFMYSLNGLWHILRANKLIISSSHNDVSFFRLLPGRFKSIQLWHGSPIKNFPFSSKGITLPGKLNTFFLKRQYSKYEFVLHTCEKTRWVLEQCFLTKKIKILGYPRNDCLFEPTNFEKKINLEQYKKIFLYMPTFRDKKSSVQPFSRNGLNKLNKFLKDNDYVLFARKHFAERNWKLDKSYSNIIDVSSIGDAQELMSKTDVLISDYSGASLDFCLLNRPIIFYPYDYKEYSSKSRKLSLDYFQDLPGPFAYDENKLLELIKNSDNWFANKKYKTKYNKFVDTFNKFKDANSSRRVYREILLREFKK